jgi:hypothetical protein
MADLEHTHALNDVLGDFPEVVGYSWCGANCGSTATIGSVRLSARAWPFAKTLSKTPLAATAATSPS